MTRRIRSAAVCFLALGLALSAGRGAAANTNIDFAAHVAFGAPALHAISSSRGYTVAGFNNTLVVFNSTKPESPAVAGLIELGTPINDVSYYGRYAFVATTASGLVVVDLATPSAPTRVGALALTGSALSVAVTGSTAYVGTTTGLYVVDVSTPATPTLKGSVTGFAAIKVAVVGSYVYVACGSAGIKVVDATTPTAPTVAATVATAGAAAGVAVSGSALYAAIGASGLAIYGISTPTAPTLSATLSVGGAANGVAANGTTVFVAGDAASVVDASTSSSPRLIGQVVLDAPGQGVAIAGSKLEIIGATGMSIIDVSTPTAPLKSALYPAVRLGNDIVIDGDIAAISGGALNSVIIMDVSVPKHPALRGALSFGSCSHGRLRLKDGYAYVGSGGTVYVVDATATPPATVKTLPTGSGSVRGLAIAGKYLFVANYSPNVVLAYDVSVASSPTLVGVLSTPFIVEHLLAYKGFLYLAGGTTLQIVDARVPASMSLRGQFTANDTIADVAVSGTVAYVPTNGGLTLLDVTDAGAPQWLSFDAAAGTSYGVALSGTRAYVASFAGALVEDVHDPYAPASIGLFNSGGAWQATGIAQTSGWAFVVTSADGVYLFHSAGECYDPFERNNDQAEAWPLAAPAIVQPMICDANDVDWFKVTAPSGGTIQAAMTPPTGANYDLFLYDAAGNPVAGSIGGGDATEGVAYTFRQGGDWFLKVVGASGSFNAALPYTLYSTFAACVAPTQPVYVYGSVRDVNNNVTLNVQDPNQPTSVGGYNIYRATAPQGPWTLLAANVVDMDKSLANVQYTDVGSNNGTTYFYRVTAVNAACGAEGP